MTRSGLPHPCLSAFSLDGVGTAEKKKPCADLRVTRKPNAGLVSHTMTCQNYLLVMDYIGLPQFKLGAPF